jgi:hypothetical protein
MLSRQNLGLISFGSSVKYESLPDKTALLLRTFMLSVTV